MLIGIGISLDSQFASGSAFPGPNLLSTSAWTMYNGCTNSGGTLTCSGTGTGIASQPITYVVTGQYQFDCDYNNSTGNQFAEITIDISAGAANTDQKATTGFLGATTGHITLTFTADIASGTCNIVQSNADITGTLSNISLKRIA